jgi:N-acylneuraminate cytidylyltransferase
MSSLAIIPARGGSKSIPHKNIKSLCGKPLIAWTIEVALAAEAIDRVVVSTDDEEIARVSRNFGAEVVRRPAEIAGSLASSESALIHVLQRLQEDEGYRPEVVAFLQCTSPLTMPADIEGVIRLVTEGGYDSAVSMVPFHYFIWREDDKGRMVGVNHVATRRLMRQERETEYLEVGAAYVMRASGLIEHEFRFFGRVGRYLLPAARAFEIDEPEDWSRAEMLLRTTGKLPWSLARKHPFARTKALVTDFDGVMTDNRVLVDQEGHEAVTCNRGDGWGISLLKRAGVVVACISTEVNPVVRARCEKLDIPYWQGQTDKLSALKSFLAQERIRAEDTVYIGNDTNDRACLDYVGLAVVPRDAAPEVLPLADWQTEALGGAGVIREVASRILEEKRYEHD